MTVTQPAVTQSAATRSAATPLEAGAQLPRGQVGLLGVMMPALAQIAPAFNLFLTAGAIAGLAGASVPLVFLISMVGMVATGSSLAQFSAIYPSSGSFVTYIAKTIGPAVASAIGVITIVGYIIAFAGVYIFVGGYIVQNVLGNPHITGITGIVTVVYGILVTLPVVIGLKFGIRTTVVLYVFEVALLVALILAILIHGGHNGLSARPFTLSGKTNDVLVSFSLAILAFGGFEAAAPLAEETRNPRRNVPIAVIGSVLVSGVLYVFGSYALVEAFGTNNVAKLAADANPYHTAAHAFISVLTPLVTYIFLSSVTSSFVSANTQTSRVIFGGARGGLWPRSLGSISARFKTPWIAAIAFAAPSVAIGVISVAFTSPGTAFGLLGTWGILGLILMYLMANLALIVHWARHGGNPITRVLLPVVGIVVLAIPIWGDLKPGQPAPLNNLWWLTICLVGIGTAYALYLRITRPEVLQRAPALLEGVADDEDQAATV